MRRRSKLGAKLAAREYRPRRCDVCGLPYKHRSVIEGWTTQNPGHHGGWSKSFLRLCYRCAPGPVVVKVMIVAETSRPKLRSVPGTGRRRVGAA
jgi:hypothetical protein